MDEEWKVIKGFIGYEVSSLGRVRSFRPRNGRGKLKETPAILKTKLDKEGYVKPA